MMREKTVEQYRAEIRDSIKRDSQIFLWNAFWAHIIFISHE